MTRKLVVMVALAVFLATSIAPQPARADDDNLVYIIPAAVAGVVAVIVIVAILMADRTEPEFEVQARTLPLPPEASPPPLRIGMDCPSTAAGQPLLCW